MRYCTVQYRYLIYLYIYIYIIRLNQEMEVISAKNDIGKTKKHDQCDSHGFQVVEQSISFSSAWKTFFFFPVAPNTGEAMKHLHSTVVEA